MFDNFVYCGKPSTARVKKRYLDLLEAKPCIDSQRALLFTDYLRIHRNEPLHHRTAGAYHHVLSNLTPVIWEDELIVGSISRYLKGAQLYPEHFDQFYHYISTFTDFETSGTNHRLKRGHALLSCSISSEEMADLKQVAAFWKDKHWVDLCSTHLEETFCTQDYSDAVRYGPESLFLAQHNSGESLAINYDTILRQGLDDILLFLQKSISSIESTGRQNCAEKIRFYKRLILAIQGIIIFAEKYAAEAEILAKKCTETKRASELYEIARICKKVPRKPPATFREAIQFFWFIHICLCLEHNGRRISMGRFDQYMNPFFKNDLSKGTLSETEALELLELFRIKCEQIIIANPTCNGDFQASCMNQHISIAGSDDNDNPSDTILSKFLLQTRVHIHTQQPIIAVMWRDDLSDFFKRKVVDCIKTIDWCPDIYKDRTEPQEETEQAMPHVQYHTFRMTQYDTSQNNSKLISAINALIKTHNITIFDLLVKDDLFSKENNRLLEDAFRQKFFNKLVREYADIIRRTVREKSLILDHIFLSYNTTGSPFLTPWGAPNNSVHGVYHVPRRDELIVSYGLIDLAKTLTIIKKYVHEEAIFTVSEIRDAIVTDFEGSETMRYKLLVASSQAEQSPFFEDVLIELLDTWSALNDDTPITPQNLLRKRIKLINELPGSTERTSHLL